MNLEEFLSWPPSNQDLITLDEFGGIPGYPVAKNRRIEATVLS
jgi:hypothetical protein